MKTEDELLEIKREVGALLKGHELNVEEVERIHAAGLVEVLLERHNGNVSRVAAELIQLGYNMSARLRHGEIARGEVIVQPGGVPKLILPKTH